MLLIQTDHEVSPTTTTPPTARSAGLQGGWGVDTGGADAGRDAEEAAAVEEWRQAVAS